MAPVLVKYHPDDHDAVVHVLRSAFEDDPIMNNVWSPKTKFRWGTQAMFEAELNFRGEETYVLKDGDEVLGAIVFGEKKFWFLQTDLWVLMRECKYLGLWSSLCTAWAYLSSLLWILERLQKKYSQKTRYVKVVGIASAHHGKGYGSLMMRECLAIRDAEGPKPYYLESSNPMNIKFYERQGFVVKETAYWRGCALTAMVRDA
eukprot:TRINITY_DN6767_c0_g1_i4.p1 TRINITY_DN6767_c0_g1~~TRINITY_DN6767_c0_g1_i4.p1  ORF type:complete len:219 (+),score=38.43 TRINITY_DN6767_c0_g1_i4:51-659(+)